MGALTINRKRANDFANLSYLSTPNISFNSNSENQVSKKPRVSYENSIAQKHPSPVFRQSIGSRIRRYPEPTQHFRREVHAPCRKHKFFGSVSSGGETRSDDMGNFLSNRYVEARNSAYETFQHWREDKSGIDVEAECSKREVPSNDYSVEEVEILDDGREGEGRSVVTEQRSLETNGVAYLQEKYAKFPDYVASSPGVTDLANQIPKVDDTEKMLESLSVISIVKELGVLPHQKLYESAERRNSRLGYIAFQIGLETKKLSFLSKTAKKPEEDALREPFASLTEEDEGEISRALSNSNRRKILVTHEDSNIQITGEVMQCLRPGAWLNDEVINLYLELLKEREKREPKKFLKCHFFNTFFYKKLISGRGGYDYKAVKRWTTQRKIGYGLIECDKIFVPIHKEIHWCLAIINRKEEKFQYLDSLKGRDTHALKVLARYFMEEVKDKSAKDIDVSSWKVEYVDDLPEQENGWDCGMFMLKYTDFYSRGLGLRFNQLMMLRTPSTELGLVLKRVKTGLLMEHMPYFRDRTIKEILRLKAE